MCKEKLWFAGCLFLLAAIPVFAQTNAPAESVIQAEQLESLRKAVAGTPYSALVVHTKVEITPLVVRSSSSSKSTTVKQESDEERHIYHARVFEKFKGKVSSSVIRYEMVVEKGESAVLDSKPQILTLCEGPRGLYSPGVGTSFPGEGAMITLAKKAAKQSATHTKTSNSLCDQP